MAIAIASDDPSQHPNRNTFDVHREEEIAGRFGPQFINQKRRLQEMARFQCTECRSGDGALVLAPTGHRIVFVFFAPKRSSSYPLINDFVNYLIICAPRAFSRGFSARELQSTSPERASTRGARAGVLRGSFDFLQRIRASIFGQAGASFGLEAGVDST